jgi:hypothetical protein
MRKDESTFGTSDLELVDQCARPIRTRHKPTSNHRQASYVGSMPARDKPARDKKVIIICVIALATTDRTYGLV